MENRIALTEIQSKYYTHYRWCIFWTDRRCTSPWNSHFYL